MKISVDVRYFAAAADAAGTDAEKVTLPASATIQDLRSYLGEAHGAELTRVLELCSFLLNGTSAEDSAELRVGDDGAIRLDVLPPFAGG